MPLHLRAFLRRHHRPLLQCLGAWPFSHWAPCLGQGQHFIAREDEMCSFEMSVPTGSHTGEKEVGQKSWAALWCAGGFIQMICSACIPGGMQVWLLGMQDLASWCLQDWGEKLPLWGLTVHVLQLNVQGRQAGRCRLALEHLYPVWLIPSSWFQTPASRVTFGSRG